MSSRTGIYSWINDHTFVLLASTDLAFSVRCFLNPPISWLSPKLRSFDFKDRRSGFKGKKNGSVIKPISIFCVLLMVLQYCRRWQVNLTRRWAGWSAGGGCGGSGERAEPSRESPHAPPARPWHQAPQLGTNQHGEDQFKTGTSELTQEAVLNQGPSQHHHQWINTCSCAKQRTKSTLSCELIQSAVNQETWNHLKQGKAMKPWNPPKHTWSQLHLNVSFTRKMCLLHSLKYFQNSLILLHFSPWLYSENGKLWWL